MSVKKIVIKKCTDCPHLSHTGGFTKGGAKPCCDHNETVKDKGFDCFERVIPYKTDYSDIEGRMAVKGIPKWCPLEDN